MFLYNLSEDESNIYDFIIRKTSQKVHKMFFKNFFIFLVIHETFTHDEEPKF